MCRVYWFELLAKFDFKLLHRSGSRHQNADAINRRPNATDSEEPEQCPFEFDDKYNGVPVPNSTEE